MSSSFPSAPPILESDASPEAVKFGKPASGWRRTLFSVIFESDTRAGKIFDITLLFVIVVSVLIVVLDSVHSVGGRYRGLFDLLEWSITLLFTGEYLARLACVERPARYARSFFGVVDLVAILPTYLALFFPALQVLMDIRLLRMVRAFRILKLAAYIDEYRALGAALNASRRKILVFLGTVGIIVLLLGTVMYLVEGPKNGFTSIPMSVYWAISTMTTVGFGDIVPKTDLGRGIASFIMLLGWGILAVPTGIVTAEMTGRRMEEGFGKFRRCPVCHSPIRGAKARYCEQCGAALAEP